jgi:murein L,D-transpeptidase YafK
MRSWTAALIILVVMSVLTCSQKPEITGTERPMLGILKDPKITIRKKKRTLEVYDGDQRIKTFAFALGFAPVGDKEIEGDGKTPEGEFYVAVKNPKSKFHLSLGLSYPSKEDAARGFAAGLISNKERDDIVSALEAKKMPPQKTKLGGEVFIHGGGTASDWTWGCIALKNEEIEELFAAVPVGTSVTILP